MFQLSAFEAVLYSPTRAVCARQDHLFPCPILSQFIKAVAFSLIISLHVISHYCAVWAITDAPWYGVLLDSLQSCLLPALRE